MNLRLLIYLLVINLIPAHLARKFQKSLIKKMRDKIYQEDFQGTKNNFKPQVLIDITNVSKTDRLTGIQRLVKSILSEFEKITHKTYDIKLIYELRKNCFCYFGNSLTKGYGNSANAVVVRKGDIFLGLDLMPASIIRNSIILLKWKLSGVAFHFIIYDLLPVNEPRFFNHKTVEFYKRWFRWLAVNATTVICISKVVECDFKKYLLKKYDITNIELPSTTMIIGSDLPVCTTSEKYSENILQSKAKDIHNIQFLMVGTIEPRKGYHQTICAFEILWKKYRSSKTNIKLLIIGSKGWKTEKLQRKILKISTETSNLVWYENASDEILSQSYRDCSALLASSFAEGYGLPLVEGANYRVPIFARDIPIFREINLPNTQYFSANTPDELAIEIDKFISATLLMPKNTASKPLQIPDIHLWSDSAKNLLDLIHVLNKT